MGLAIMWPFQHATIKTKVVVRPRTLLQALQTAIQKHGISNVVATYSSKIVMAALWNRAGHYIFVMWFLSSFFFIPRLISVVADWMSTILLHMVWP